VSRLPWRQVLPEASSLPSPQALREASPPSWPLPERQKV
jgi:hypothetical protein